jgi:Cu/Ag efflux pump CusA
MFIPGNFNCWVQFTTHTVLHNLTEGFILVVIVLMLFLGNIRGAVIVALTIPFSLLFASILLQARHIPANLLSLGALDFGMVVDGAVVMVENIVRHLCQQEGVTKSVPDRIRAGSSAKSQSSAIICETTAWRLECVGGLMSEDDIKKKFPNGLKVLKSYLRLGSNPE